MASYIQILNIGINRNMFFGLQKGEHIQLSWGVRKNFLSNKIYDNLN